MKSKGKKKVKLIKEEVAEDWCFVCKDGGAMRICDYKECLKSYHPRCVEKDESFLDSESNWKCDWHTCSECSKNSEYYCYTCVYSLCRRCNPAGAFEKVRGKNGFCDVCLDLAILVEENRDCDSDGNKVDFKDRNTVECLFKEYYLIIKDTAKFKSKDIYDGYARLKKNKDIKSRSDSEEIDDDVDDDEEQVSDYDGLENENKRNKSHRKKRSNKKQKSSKQTPSKSNKMEFIGWGSKPLIEFLVSIGKIGTQKLSHNDVFSLVDGYIKEYKLFDTERRKLVICDARLQSLFKKDIIKKSKVSHLLESHFAENQDESEDDDDELEYNSKNEGTGILDAIRNKRKLDMEKKPQKETKNGVSLSVFALVVVENLKLVYLKKSLLVEILKQPESFEEKVIGSFVRVKSDKYDYTAKNSHQLMQVKGGVKIVPIGEGDNETVLLLSGIPKEIRISLISDDNFSEAECEDLRQKMQAGILERLTMVELEQKAKILHKDITNHWIGKELALLQKKIDRANEKGWRREYFEYLEKKEMLLNPLEKERMLNNFPTVIPDISELDSNPEDIENRMESDEDSPKSTLQYDSSAAHDKWLEKGISVERTHHGNETPPKRKTPDSEFKSDGKSMTGPLQLSSEEKMNKLKARKSPQLSPVDVIELPSDVEEIVNGNVNLVIPPQQIFDDLESRNWCILGPHGERDKCSLSVLKSWINTGVSYAYKFKAWKEDQNEENAMWLKDVIEIAFPKNENS